MKLCISDPAKEDLIEIWEFIAKKNPKAAAKLMKLIKSKFELLLNFPHLGRERHELIIGSRSLPVGKYIIIYQSTDEILEIIRVRHGATNLDDLFDI